MNRIAALSLLLASLLPGVCAAADQQLCKPLCADTKRECRAGAQRSAELDTSPAFEMKETTPNTREFGEVKAGSKEIQASERRNFQDRRMERVHACDDKYMRCVAACSSPAPASDTSEVLIKRASKR